VTRRERERESLSLTPTIDFDSGSLRLSLIIADRHSAGQRRGAFGERAGGLRKKPGVKRDVGDRSDDGVSPGE